MTKNEAQSLLQIKISNSAQNVVECITLPYLVIDQNFQTQFLKKTFMKNLTRRMKYPRARLK